VLHIADTQGVGYPNTTATRRGEHRFVLEAQGEYTRLTQSEHFTGILAGRLTRGIIDETIEAMQQMNRALKVRAESSARLN
jgi:hypothetical protein